jgi:DNA-binding HxlR family transcriptional regulator
MSSSTSDPEPRSHCPICFSLDIVGDRWTLLVLRDLIIRRKRHFRDLLASEERIASNILTARLKQLEESGVVTRRPDPDNARQVIYEPTPKGLDLLPAMLEFARWGAKYDASTALPKDLLRRVEADRDAVIRDFRAPHERAASTPTGPAAGRTRRRGPRF